MSTWMTHPQPITAVVDISSLYVGSQSQLDVYVYDSLASQPQLDVYLDDPLAIEDVTII